MHQPTRRGFVCSLSALALAPLAGAREANADVVIIGGSLGGVAAALAAADAGCRVVMTEEVDWIGGQATAQGVPTDEHPWIEQRGRNRSYAAFRQGVRDYYRRNYPLTEASQRDSHFNPGAGWVSACGFEPRAGLAVLYQMLAAHLTSGRVRILNGYLPIAVDRSGDRLRAVTLRSLQGKPDLTLAAPYFLDATETGELLPLGKIEYVTGAESQKETGEPSAAPEADPLRMQPITHLLALDYLPGEDHRIAKPASYDRWRPKFQNLTGFAETKDDELQLRFRRLFARTDGPNYESSIWNFRRVFYAGNFRKGAFPSDITMLMNGNEYFDEPIIEVPEADARRRLQEARELSLSVLYFLQNEISNGFTGKPGFPGLRARGDVFGTAYGLAQYPYIRESRRIRAEFTMLEQHFRTDLNPKGPVLYTDAAGVSGYRMDIHERAKSGQSQTWALHGKHWTQQLALGALIPRTVENVLAACKNLGTTHITNGSFRVHPAEWTVGEAAGALAGYCVNKKLAPRQVRNTPAHLKDFQRTLEERGVELAWAPPEVSKSYNSVYATVPGWYFGESWRRK
jgi:hypothetical protein